MQLGARWRAGEEPHRSVPPVLYEAITAQEAAHPAASAWTLTFLEGRPRCALDDVLTLTLDAAGSVHVEAPEGLTGDRFAQGLAPVEGVPEDEDDDWLN